MEKERLLQRLEQKSTSERIRLRRTKTKKIIRNTNLPNRKKTNLLNRKNASQVKAEKSRKSEQSFRIHRRGGLVGRLEERTVATTKRYLKKILWKIQVDDEIHIWNRPLITEVRRQDANLHSMDIQKDFHHSTFTALHQRDLCIGVSRERLLC
ncbi:hypothetical protein L9F63_011443, partial [Diploptera punctata]